MLRFAADADWVARTHRVIEQADLVLAQLGSNSYIVKPVDFRSFADVVKTLKMYWSLTGEPPFGAARHTSL